MTAFIRPSLILRMDLDERLFNDECVSDIKRSYSYVAPSLVQAHKPVDGQHPENVMRFMIKLHRAYWDKSDEAAQRLWEGVMPKWLHNMFSKVSNTITAANNVRAENGQPAFPYHWLELEFGDNALIAVKTGSDSSFPADRVDMVERVRDLMNCRCAGAGYRLRAHPVARQLRSAGSQPPSRRRPKPPPLPPNKANPQVRHLIRLSRQAPPPSRRLMLPTLPLKRRPRSPMPPSPPSPFPICLRSTWTTAPGASSTPTAPCASSTPPPVRSRRRTAILTNCKG